MKASLSISNCNHINLEWLTLRHELLFVRGGSLMSHFIGIIRLSPPSYTKPLQAIRSGQLRHHAAPRSVPNVSLTITSRNKKKIHENGSYLTVYQIMCENTDSRFETVCLILVAVHRADVEHGSKQSPK